MARPSKLTEKQWAEIERRHVRGEKIRPMAREFGVSEAAIRARVSTQSNEVKAVAQQIIDTELRFNALPISAQVSARSLADDLRSISTHLASAAKYGSMTAHRLSGMAHAQLDKIDDGDPMASENVLKGISALTRISNDASQIGIGLIKASKDTGQDDAGKRSITDVLADAIAKLPG